MEVVTSETGRDRLLISGKDQRESRRKRRGVRGSLLSVDVTEKDTGFIDAGFLVKDEVSDAVCGFETLPDEFVALAAVSGANEVGFGVNEAVICSAIAVDI